jgi:hypothetical protein
MMLPFLLYLFLFQNGVTGFQTELLSFSLLQYQAPVSKSLHPLSTSYSTRYWHPLVQRQASETSFGLGDAPSSKAGTIRKAVERNLGSLPTLATTRGVVSELFLKSWWISPMFLALVPLYCAICKGTCAAMPHWWQLVNIDYILKSDNAAMVVGCFLSSNIAYFLSGGYIVKRFPFQASKQGDLLPFQPTKFTMLGVWILAAGLVSTIFHSVQALGAFQVAESLCYLDHGVAISAGLYYVDTLGLPSRRTLALGLASLVCLVVTYPGYAWLHSSWHFLSAAAAALWAIEGHAQQRDAQQRQSSIVLTPDI